VVALVMLAPFGPRPVVAGAAAWLGNAADDHEHRVSVRTSGVCADVVIEHDAAKPDGSAHEHREICLSRGADALLSKLSAAGVVSAAFGLALAPTSARASATAPRAAGLPDRSPPDLRALRTIILRV